MLLMLCHFVSSVMLLPRLLSIWKGIDGAYEDERFNEIKKVEFYMNDIRKKLNRKKSFTSTEKTSNTTTSVSSELSKTGILYRIEITEAPNPTEPDIGIESNMFVI